MRVQTTAAIGVFLITVPPLTAATTVEDIARLCGRPAKCAIPATAPIAGRTAAGNSLSDLQILNAQTEAIGLLDQSRKLLKQQNASLAQQTTVPEAYQQCARASSSRLRVALACQTANFDHAAFVSRGRTDTSPPQWRLVPEAFAMSPQSLLSTGEPLELSSVEKDSVQRKLVAALVARQDQKINAWKDIEKSALENLARVQRECKDEAKETARQCPLAPFVRDPNESASTSWQRMRGFATNAANRFARMAIAPKGEFTDENLDLAESAEPQLRDLVARSGGKLCGAYALLQEKIAARNRPGISATDALLAVKSPGPISALIGAAQSLAESYRQNESAATTSATGAINGDQLVQAADRRVSAGQAAGSALASAGAGLVGMKALGGAGRMAGVMERDAAIVGRATATSFSHSDVNQMLTLIESRERAARSLIGTDAQAEARAEQAERLWLAISERCDEKGLKSAGCQELMKRVSKLLSDANASAAAVSSVATEAPKISRLADVAKSDITQLKPDEIYHAYFSAFQKDVNVKFTEKAIKQAKADPQRAAWLAGKADTHNADLGLTVYRSIPGMVKIKNKGPGGHQRFLGCMEGGEVVIKYYGLVPENANTFDKLFGDLCK